MAPRLEAAHIHGDTVIEDKIFHIHTILTGGDGDGEGGTGTNGEETGDGKDGDGQKPKGEIPSSWEKDRAYVLGLWEAVEPHFFLNKPVHLKKVFDPKPLVEALSQIDIFDVVMGRHGEFLRGKSMEGVRGTRVTTGLEYEDSVLGSLSLQFAHELGVSVTCERWSSTAEEFPSSRHIDHNPPIIFYTGDRNGEGKKVWDVFLSDSTIQTFVTEPGDILLLGDAPHQVSTPFVSEHVLLTPILKTYALTPAIVVFDSQRDGVPV